MGTKGDTNRQRIVDAANQLFYTRGYNQTSFRDISVETGIPRGNFYYYFKTKDDILGAVIDARLESQTELLKQCEAQTDDPRERLVAFIDGIMQHEDNIIELGCPLGTLSTELAKDTEELHALSRAVFDLIRKWMSAQFSNIGLEQADERTLDLLTRIQGAGVIASTFKDVAFLQRSMAETKTWINSHTLN